MEITFSQEDATRLLTLAAQGNKTPRQILMHFVKDREEVLAALTASAEDFDAGRWISLEDYEAQIKERRQKRDATKDKQ